MEYKSNSFKSKEEPSQIAEKKTIKGRLKKKSNLERFTESFIKEDISNVGRYILTEVIIPAVKKAIDDTVTSGISMILYGNTDRIRKKSDSRSSYHEYYEKDRNRSNSSRPNGRYNYNEIIFDTRSEAEEVLDMMAEAIDTYGVVSVGDFYEFAGYSGSYTDNKYGWKDIHNASVAYRSDGYVLKLPRAIPID